MSPRAVKTARASATRVLLAILGVGIIATLGFAIWSSTGRPRADSSPSASRSGVATSAATGTGGIGNQVRTSTAHGSHAGYDATVQVTRTDVGATTVTTLDVVLTTQATPASAPTAAAQLIGADDVKHDVALTIVGAGHWTSKQVTIAAGRYTLSARFDRRGAAVLIPMTVVLT
ncbi:MAG: hypothetical protein JWO57_4518 [Pseudonocardiales bacterium]|jgi:hypothetical protein|nr:hypothetical protein [Pseudonocardiales bacterium]